MKKYLRIMAAVLALALALGGAVSLAEAEGAGTVIPEITGLKQYNVPDTEAFAFVKQMKIGWNLGNTLDAYDDSAAGYTKGTKTEISWGNPWTTEELMQAIHDAGFETVRIPVSWHNHVDEEYQIDGQWMTRVKAVVGFALNQGMYVILNIHHDNQEKFLYPDQAHLEQSRKYVGTIWKQVAEAFKDCDDHLILEGMNEPRLVGTNFEWYWDANNARCKEAADCINQLNQLFVDTVRATGGNNATRYLMVTGYDASPWYVSNKAFQLPQDSAENRLIISSHAYTPYNFALNLNDPDTRFDLEKDAQKKKDINDFLNALYQRFVSQGVPVIMDEFGALDKGGALQDRVNFAAYYVAAATSRGIPCVWWDNGNLNGGGERFCLIKRSDLTWVYPEIVEAMMKNLAQQ